MCRILIGNKSDKEAERKISFEQGADLAKQYEMPFLEASAKSSFNVEEVFNTITKAISEKLARSQPSQNNINSKLKKGSSIGGEARAGCC